MASPVTYFSNFSLFSLRKHHRNNKYGKVAQSTKRGAFIFFAINTLLSKSSTPRVCLQELPLTLLYLLAHRTQWYQKRLARYSIAVQAVVVLTSFFLALPLAIALFPQFSEVRRLDHSSPSFCHRAVLSRGFIELYLAERESPRLCPVLGCLVSQDVFKNSLSLKEIELSRFSQFHDNFTANRSERNPGKFEIFPYPV